MKYAALLLLASQLLYASNPLLQPNNNQNINFIDLVPVLTDENGNLLEEASTDGIHLNKKYCLKWLECLKSN